MKDDEYYGNRNRLFAKKFVESKSKLIEEYISKEERKLCKL